MLSLVLAVTALVAAPQQPASTSADPALQTEPAETPAVSTAAAQPAIDAGIAAFKRHRFSKAEAEFSRALQTDPQSAAAHFYLGYTYYKMAEPTRRLTSNKQKAAALFAKAYELDPGFRPVWQRRQ